MTKPEIWLSENVKRRYKLIRKIKCDGIEEHQSNVTKIENGYCYRETFVKLTNVEDRGEFWYVGIKPIGKDKDRFGFGYIRIYKCDERNKGNRLEDITGKIDVLKTHTSAFIAKLQ